MKKAKHAPAGELDRQVIVQEALRRLQDHHELILNAVSDGILALDVDDRIMFANSKAAVLLGYTVDQLVGELAGFILHGRIESPANQARICDGRPRHVTNDVFKDTN